MKLMPAILSAAMMISLQASASNDAGNAVSRQALRLYQHGMYERARTLFEQSDDPLSKAYALLCAMNVNSDECSELLSDYEKNNPKSVLYNQMHYVNAMHLFDEGMYPEASAELKLIDPKKLDSRYAAEYAFKNGYCEFVRGNHLTAETCFQQVLESPRSEYTAPARYSIGYMAYLDKNFPKAVEWLEQSASDLRFKDLSSYYILESKFMLKDYDYVIRNGEQAFETVPEERKPRLARMLSECYLIRGDKQKAREYLAKEQTDVTGASRSDLFHAGSVLYAVDDYEGAIKNFSAMPERTDSLGQIANYQLGYSYVRTKNKVAAMDAFKAASELTFREDIHEDAFFNFAKLSFDLNNDIAPFNQYIKTYGTSKKGNQIYDYIALTSLYGHDYVGAIEAYSNMDSLNEEQKLNYMKANYLRANQLIGNGSYRDAVPYLKAASFYLPKSDKFSQLSRYWLAEAYYLSGDYTTAEKTYSDLYNTTALYGLKESEMLPYNIAYCWLKQKNYSNAARWFDKYAGKDQREDALTRRADCDFARKDYKTAAASYQKVLDEYFNADVIYPYFQQGLAYGLSGDKQGKINSLKAVRSASTSAPMYSEAMYELGRAYMDAGDNSEAAFAFTTLRYNTPDSTYAARALIGLGMARRNTGDYEEALASYKQVVSLMPDSEYSSDALLAINSIYQTLKQPEKYLEYVEENKLNTGKTEAEKEAIYYNTAEQIFLAGNYQQAIPSLEKYMKMYPDGENVGKAWFYLAESRKALGDKEQACEAYAQAASRLSSGSFAEMARLNHAALSYDLERYDEAYKGYSDLLAMAVMDESKETAKVGMMRSAYKARNYENAISAATSLSTDEARYILAKSCLATSKRDEAMVIFRELAANPSTAEGAEASCILIQDTLDKGDFAKVETMVYNFAKNCGSQNYWLAKAYLQLGDAFLGRGNVAQAKATYESIRDGYTPTGTDDDIQDNVKARLERLGESQKNQ